MKENEGWTFVTPLVRRFELPNNCGWLYQVAIAFFDSSRDGIVANGWHPPTFVPGPVRKERVVV